MKIHKYGKRLTVKYIESLITDPPVFLIYTFLNILLSKAPVHTSLSPLPLQHIFLLRKGFVVCALSDTLTPHVVTYHNFKNRIRS